MHSKQAFLKPRRSAWATDPPRGQQIATDGGTVHCKHRCERRPTRPTDVNAVQRYPIPVTDIELLVVTLPDQRPEDAEAGGRRRHADLQLPVEPPRPPQRRVQRIRPVGRRQHHHPVGARRGACTFARGILEVNVQGQGLRQGFGTGSQLMSGCMVRESHPAGLTGDTEQEDDQQESGRGKMPWLTGSLVGNICSFLVMTGLTNRVAS